jgi:MFS family permease
MSRDGKHVTFRDVFAVSEFRALWSAQILSIIGDQLAMVALVWLVHDLTGSALLAAITYAVSFLPWALGGPLLAGLADRLPRREVMVGCDVVRAALVALMIVPGMPLWVLVGLLFFAELLSPLFSAARSATMPNVLPGDRYVVASAVTNITQQAGQVLGFALGGAMVALLGTRPALLVDAATFLVSAIILRLWVRYRAVSAAPDGRHSLRGSLRDGIRLVFGNPYLRSLALFAWLCTFYVVPEGLAAPYATARGGGPGWVGILLAAGAFGAASGAFVLGRFVQPDTRIRLMGPLAIAACSILLLCALRPGLVMSAVIFAASGFAGAYQVIANAAFVVAVPDHARAQAYGLVGAGLAVGQGLGIVLAGAIAQVIDPTYVVAFAGVLGTVLAASLTATSRRIEPVPALT